MKLAANPENLLAARVYQVALGRMACGAEKPPRRID